MADCPPPDLLLALLRDNLERNLRSEVETHLTSCTQCKQVFSSFGETAILPDTVTPPRTILALPATLTAPTVSEQSSNAETKLIPKLEVPGYRLIEELGRGGMGVVYKAHQLSLDRVVALKMIRSAAIARSAELARFRIEAESLAQLQHPNIVQVFDVGQHQEMPYLAMEFVPGETLAHAIAKHGITIQQSAKLVESLARAMHSAHQRGILHRDLKPSNVLLGLDGEPKVTDFGLAKRVASDCRLTASGVVMGTPNYMPPEQARGKVGEIGPRSDVYSLGAILYEMLSGRPPFLASTPLLTIQQVIEEDPASPRSFNPRVPRDLETICLKCLNKEPRKRYETAADLADDLMRFQRDQPILGRRVGWLGHGWRWCRRNPAFTAALASTLLLVIGAAVAVGWQSHQTELARTQAKQQHQRFAKDADEKFQLIRTLLERVPEEERAQDERLQTALRSYESWLAEEPTDPDAANAYAKALFRVADIRRRIGQFAKAEDSFQQAIRRYEQLVESAPDEHQLLQELAESLNWLGESYREGGQLAEAIEAYDAAVTHQTKLASTLPLDTAYRADLARSLLNRALALRELNQLERAENDLRRSLEILQKCLQEQPGDRKLRQGAARSRMNLGIVLRAAERPVDARREYEAATQLLTELKHEDPQSAEYRFELAMSLMNQANLFVSTKAQSELQLEDPFGKARQAFESSNAILRELISSHENVPVYRKELANSLNGLGAAILRVGAKEAAEQAWLDAVEVLRKLIDKSPTVAEYHALLGQVNFNLAYLYGESISAPQLEGYLRQATGHQTQAVELSPGNALYAKSLRSYIQMLSRVLAEVGKHVEAAQLAEQLAASDAGDGQSLYLAAQRLFHCSRTVEQDQPLEDNQRTQVGRKYRERVLELLQACRRKGITVNPKDFPGLETPDEKPHTNVERAGTR